MFTKDLGEIQMMQMQSFRAEEFTCGFSATYFAHCRINRIASIDVSGMATLQANSDKHLIAS